MPSNPISDRLTRAEIRRRLREMPVSRQQVRLMQKALAELRRENALLTYMLSVRKKSCVTKRRNLSVTVLL